MPASLITPDNQGAGLGPISITRVVRFLGRFIPVVYFEASLYSIIKFDNAKTCLSMLLYRSIVFIYYAFYLENAWPRIFH